MAVIYKKVMSGQQLTKNEQRDLRRFERDKEEKLRWQYYASIPQKHWIKMSGRQAKVLIEQALRYGIPSGGATVDLSTVIRAWHDFLAKNAAKLASESDPMLVGGSSPALEQYREEKAKMARMDRLERERELIPRHQARDTLSKAGGFIRAAGEKLHLQFGSSAAEILFEALDDAQREIDSTFGDQPTGDASHPC